MTKKELNYFRKRKDKIIAMREKGMTYEKIAVKMGVSRQRIFQICKHLTNPDRRV